MQEELKMGSKDVLLAQLFIGWHLLVHNCPAFLHGPELFLAVHLDLHLQTRSTFKSGWECDVSELGVYSWPFAEHRFS